MAFLRRGYAIRDALRIAFAADEQNVSKGATLAGPLFRGGEIRLQMVFSYNMPR